MIVFKSYKTELNPNNKQHATLFKCANVARWVYNWGLAKRIEEYKTTGKLKPLNEQCKELVRLKRTPEYFWLSEVSKWIPAEALRNLDGAYTNFFKNIKKNKKDRFPKFKSKRKGKNSFTVYAPIHVFNDSIQLPKLGRIRLKQCGYIPVDGVHILSATCSERTGKWFVSVACRIDIPDPIPGTGEPIGIDLGIKSLAVCSDGRVFENPKALGKSLDKLARFNREFSRRVKGGCNWNKTKFKISKLHYRISNIRKDSLHKITSAIIKAKTKPSMVVLEDLNVSGMMKNKRLARAISDVGMYEFRRQIEYKGLWNGVKVVVAPRFYPSSKTCHVCGAINDRLALGNREWDCSCGAHLDRDLNAAINLSTVGLTESYACRESVRLETNNQAVLVEAGTNHRTSPGRS